MRPVARAAVTGLAGMAAMALSTGLEMRLRGRASSGVPADVLARALEELPGAPAARAARRLRRDEPLRRAVSWAAPWPTALAAGGVREALAAAGLDEPEATAALFVLVCLPDLGLAPLAGAAEPPWRWGADELAISLAHHLAFALAAGAARSALTARA
jgi:hypothetical protein